ncbi:hypothetical protein N0V93_000311 [Gnomoniopsis smithogilvyi]|uniref:Rhamnogalacturonase A n=1 Tax=Gnomoniopsis smithogilvyi TaxID=1191159 RepID=A0A9W9D192_9PEZI|nr:hypothetical protein N0V93_000311 [Gnomoniopsis smithogilvyi]
MAPRLFMSGLLATASYIVPAVAQLSGTVGPTTTTSSKASTKVCNIMDYGGVADASTDNGQAISDAWTACASGGEVLIPAGDYGLATWVTLNKGTGVSINLEGTIYRTGTDGGNMILIEDSTDIEFYSATSSGAIQGYGYEFHKDGSYGPRILRCTKCVDFSIHDLILVDAGAFHLSLDTCSNGEVYNMIIHGGNEGGLDGIDVWGTNIWIHDIEVSNKDECVTVKDPSKNLLIEQVHCNWSGGCAMGSLGSDVDISYIEYNYIYTHDSNQQFMIKSNGGSGTVENIAFNNFMGHSNAYTLDFDTAWSSMDTVDGDGISYSNITFSSWTGTAEDGIQRGPVKIDCPAAVPCTDITVEDFSVWTDTDDDEVLYVCQNAYGDGACLVSGDSTGTYTTTQTVTTSGDYSYQTMENELTTGYDISSSIPIPTMPASFYPGKAPISAFLSGSAESASSTGAASAAAKAAVSASGRGSSAAPSYSISSTSSAAAAAQATSGSQGSWSGYGGQSWGWGKSNAEAADAQVTPVAKSASTACKRSAKFRN